MSDMSQAIPGVAGHCVDIDGASWHADYTVCPHCRFGLWEDPSTPGRGAFGEPVMRTVATPPSGPKEE